VNLSDQALDSFYAIRNLADSAFDNRFTIVIEGPIVEYKHESGTVLGWLKFLVASE